jgi:hypothetical protein
MVRNGITENYIRQIKVNGLYFNYGFYHIKLNVLVSVRLWFVQGDRIFKDMNIQGFPCKKETQSDRKKNRVDLQVHSFLI